MSLRARSLLDLAWPDSIISCQWKARARASASGLGFLIIDGQQTGRADLIIATVILFAAFGKLTDVLLERLGQRLTRYRRA